jgi:hypothetical protein
MRKYVCSICKEEYYSVEDILKHLKTAEDELHREINKEDLDTYFEVIDLDSREWSDIEQRRIRLEPIKTEPSIPKEYLPERFVRGEEYPMKPYYCDGTYYYCSEHKFKTNEEGEFLAHILKYHPIDFETVLKHGVKTSVQKQMVKSMKEEGLKEFIDKELQQWLLKVEQKEPEKLGEYISDHFERLQAFLTGQGEICPVCHKVCSISNTLHLDKIFSALHEGVKQNKEFYNALLKYERENKGYRFWTTCKYAGTWNGEKVLLSLYPLLHFYLDHTPRFESLVNSGILKGELVEYLYEKKHLKKGQAQRPKPIEPSEKLSKGIVLKQRVQLSKDEDALLRWLDSNRIKKE